MRSWLACVAWATMIACACPLKPAAVGAGSTGSGAGSATVTGSGTAIAPVAATTCDGVRARVEALYRAEAQQKEPTRVDEAVSDNTTMAMNDCAKDPGKLVPCLAKVATVPELEKTCLIPLDDEGTEGGT
jgi:hypothetical protein